MTVIAGTLVLGTETFTNQGTTGVYRISKIDFFPVHGSPPTSQTTLNFEFDIIDGDTFSILQNNTFSRIVADGQTLVTLNELQINFTRSDGTLPSSILVNWTARVSGQTSSLDNVSNTIQFEGDLPPPETCNLSPSGNEVANGFNSNISLFDGVLNGTVTAFKNPSFDNNCNNNDVRIILFTRNTSGQLIGTPQTFIRQFGSDSVIEQNFTFDFSNQNNTLVRLEMVVNNEQGIPYSQLTREDYPETFNLPDNFSVIVQAQNGASLTEILTEADKI